MYTVISPTEDWNSIHRMQIETTVQWFCMSHAVFSGFSGYGSSIYNSDIQLAPTQSKKFTFFIECPLYTIDPSSVKKFTDPHINNWFLFSQKIYLIYWMTLIYTKGYSLVKKNLPYLLNDSRNCNLKNKKSVSLLPKSTFCEWVFLSKKCIPVIIQPLNSPGRLTFYKTNYNDTKNSVKEENKVIIPLADHYYS